MSTYETDYAILLMTLNNNKSVFYYLFNCCPIFMRMTFEIRVERECVALGSRVLEHSFLPLTNVAWLSK